ncbi:hypothetical protein Bca4012_102659 [Brassica carinata]
MHGHHAACGALPAAGPYLRLSRFRSGQAICTGGAPPGSRPRFCSDRAPSYSSRPGSCPAAGIGRASAPSISGLVDSAGNRRNQLLDGSISLSPLYPSQASDLRQYRCGPPPEFPLAARSGIVHHLSGPGSMLTLEPFSEDQGRSAVHREDQPISFLTPYGFTHPLTRTHVRLLGPCFKAGRMGAHRRRHEHADARRAVARAAEPRLRQRRLRGPLGGIYRPIGAAFPNNPTRRQRLRGATGSNAAGLSPSLAPLSRNLGPRVIRLTWGRVEDFGSSRAFGRSGGDLASEFTTACQGAPGILSSDFGQRRAVTRETSFRPISSRGLGAAICDTQAGVPSARRLGRNLRSKTSMVHGILQFTPSIAFRSFFIDHERDIRCEVVLDFTLQHCFRTNTVSGLAKAGCLVECSLTLFVRGLVISGSYAYNPAKLGGGERITTESVGAKSAKIPAHE